AAQRRAGARVGSGLKMTGAQTATSKIDAAQAPAASRPPLHALLLKGVAFNWCALVVGAAVSILLTPIMIRGLGQYYYGMWVLIMSLVDQYGLLDLGMGSALSRFAGYFQGAEARSALDEVLSTSMAFTILIAVCVCLGTVVVAAFLPPFFGFSGP